MKLQFLQKGTPIILIDNFFTDNQLSAVFKELDILNPHFLDPDQTGSAKNIESGTLLKNNKGIFLDEVYKDHTFSPICNSIVSNLSNENSNINNLWYPPWISVTWKNTTNISFLVNCYSDSDYYEYHTDVSVFTLLIWLWKEPKSFDGGNLKLESYSEDIECKNNCGIIFPSGELHAVTPVKLKNSDNKRYSIACFFACCSHH
jgi:hypothetical protein